MPKFNKYNRGNNWALFRSWGPLPSLKKCELPKEFSKFCKKRRCRIFFSARGWIVLWRSDNDSSVWNVQNKYNNADWLNETMNEERLECRCSLSDQWRGCVRAWFKPARVCTPSSPVRESEKERGREREKEGGGERKREGERERERGREGGRERERERDVEYVQNCYVYF